MTWSPEADGQGLNYADDSRSDDGESDSQSFVTAQFFNVRPTRKDPKKARHKPSPGRHQSTKSGRKDWWQLVGIVRGTEASNKLRKDDQRTRGSLCESKSVEHLTGGEPAVVLDSLLSNVRKNRISTTKNDYCGDAEEDPFSSP